MLKIKSAVIMTTLLTFFSVNTLASEKIEFRCTTTMPTTSFLLRTEGKDVILTTIHHNGTAFMPIHEGIIVPNDISYLKSVASKLTSMGERNEFKFPRSKCEVYGPGLMSCHGGERKVLNGVEMEALALHTSRITEEAYGETFQKYKVVLSVNILGFAPVQDIMNDFSNNECSFTR